MSSILPHIVPLWLSIAFLLAIPAPFILILLWVRRTEKHLDGSALFGPIAAFFAIYLAYIGLASFQGWFDPLSLPPRVLLFTTFPYAFLLFGVVLRSKAYARLMAATSVASLIQLHIFRLIGVFFILLALQDVLPRGFAFVAGTGDVLTAVSSIFVVRAVQSQQKYARKLIFWWNIFGTVDILFTAIAANVLTKISIDTGAMGVEALAAFPFCIIPAFAPPTILFLHWSIFRKIKDFPH